ncbi:HelD family protein [Inconstantimicrobium mannanitabidum]|uniref:DNA helicase n=1 Tax=Inconstantimicrobium mannanitabidum TaxID=1604901 RepID=A0ACB5RFI7_9CLOT|nr:UvrD-helicase domain-containing protein [Clostridium sp. TW13]GKX67855.1 DNA helicase [Clostridium sp. TW13]
MKNEEINEQKQVEFLVEKKKLDETLEIINSEILNYIERRKYITDYIRDYRQKVVEDYKDDEDAIIEYFDHERFVKEEAYKTIDKKLKELTILKESPYFGKVTFEEEGEEYPETLYIGRFGVTREQDLEPIIIDWRAPVASLFYHGSLGKASYDVPKGVVDTEILGRRQLIVKKAQLKGMFDSAIDVKDEILQMVLSSNTNEKLKDVIMTLQQEQDKIIRMDRNKTIVVNGVAGSGKTTIALHRVAYLLYNYRKQLENKVLILGPNAVFMEYISQVLPSLGETGVKQETFTNYAIEEIGLDESIIEFNEFIEKILSGDEAFIKDVQRKYSDKFINELDEYVEQLENNYLDVPTVKFFDKEVISAEEIKEYFQKHYAYMPLFRRSQRIKRVIFEKIREKRDEEVRILNKEIAEEKKSLSKDELLLQESNIDFKRKIRIREIIREVMDTKNRISEWIDNEDIVSLYKKFAKIERLSIADLSPILYLMIKLDGKKAKNTMRHVIIDEAQDYSKLQFIVVKELTDCKNFTIVGDSNQRLFKFSEVPAMLDLDNIWNETKVEKLNLNKSYRSTYEIMDYANKYLKEEKIVPIVRSGKAVEVTSASSGEELSSKIISEIEKINKEGLESIAIITRDADQLNRVHSLIKDKVHIAKFDNEYVIYNGGTVIIPSYFAKGLEFDAVIMLDSDGNDSNEDLIKYIISTRALHSLKVIKLSNII